MHLAETTNGKLAEAKALVRELMEWADADAEHSRENDAPETSRDDFRRGTALRNALKLLEECER